MRGRFVGVLAGAVLAALAATAAGRTVPLATLDAAKDAEQVVVTEGTVSDVCTDDFSKWFTILMLQDGDCSLPVFLHVREVPRSVRFLGARVRVRGVYHAITDGVRRFSGPYLAVDRSSDLEVVTPAPPAFSEPELGSVCDMSPQTIHRLGRRRTSGRVSAVWSKGELLLVRRGAEPVAVSLAAGGTSFADEVARQLDEQEEPIRLTDKQAGVLESLTRGLNNTDIALMLGISRSAVKKHLEAIFRKLGVSSRSEAVAIALKRQMLKV